MCGTVRRGRGTAHGRWGWAASMLGAQSWEALPEVDGRDGGKHVRAKSQCNS